MTPNILVLMVDQLAGTFFPDGPAPFLHVPALSALAARSRRFANAYAASPLCAPSRASFMSGLLPSRTRVWDNAAEFASDIPTFAHHLRRAGYATCLADPKVDLQLEKAEIQKQTLINKFCNNFEPVADPPFCCRTGGPMQQCVAATTREDCLALGGTHSVTEGRTCDMGSCANIPGPGKSLTWWEHCPNNEPCPGPTLGDMDGVIQCVDDVADQLVGNVLCLQFPNGAACPNQPWIGCRKSAWWRSATNT